MEKLESIWQIDERIIPEIASRKFADYTEELWRLFQIFRSYLSEYYIDLGRSLYDDPYIKNNIYKRTLGIKKLIYSYHIGDLIGADKYINRYFKLTGNKITVFGTFPTIEIPANFIYYRCRPSKISNRKDIFHVPFSMRGKIGTNRFSFPGYPCLYLSTSLESCVKETAKNNCAVSVSAFRNVIPLQVYDFRFFPNAQRTSNLMLKNQLLSYPFKIAASIPITKEVENNEEIVYKEEYVIPQIILHGIIRQQIGKRPKGIIYSSTKAIRDKIDINNFIKHQELSIPAMSFSEQDYCYHLRNMFVLTDPLNIDNTTTELSVYENILIQKEFQHLILAKEQ